MRARVHSVFLLALAAGLACQETNPDYLPPGLGGRDAAGPFDGSGGRGGGWEAGGLGGGSGGAGAAGDAKTETAPAADGNEPDLDGPADLPLDGPAPDGPPDTVADLPADPAAGGPDLPDLPLDAAAVDLVRGLVGHWRFDEGTGTVVRNERAPAANTGTLSNGPTWTTPGVPLRSANPACLAFDGVDDFVQIPAEGLPGLGVPLSFSLWIWVPSGSADNRDSVLTYLRLGADPVGIQLGLDEGAAAMWIYRTSTSLIESPDALPVQRWHHLGYSYDGTTHRLYLNGSIVGLNNLEKVLAVPSAIRVATYGGTAQLFRGRIDDLRLYDRVLSPAEMAALAEGR